MNSLKIPKG